MAQHFSERTIGVKNSLSLKQILASLPDQGMYHISIDQEVSPISHHIIYEHCSLNGPWIKKKVMKKEEYETAFSCESITQFGIFLL